MDAAEDRGRGVEPGLRRDLRAERPQRLVRAAQRRQEPVPAPRAHQRGGRPRLRVPEAGMAAERGDLGGHRPRQAEGPVLRPEEKAARPREALRERRLQPVQLRADIEPAGHGGRAGLGERGRTERAPRRVGAGMLVVEDRQRQRARLVHQCGAGAVGDGDDGADPERREVAQRARREGPERLHVEMRIGRAGPDAVRQAPLGDLLARRGDQHQLGVGLADVEDGRIHAAWLTAGGTRGGAAPPRGCRPGWSP